MKSSAKAAEKQCNGVMAKNGGVENNGSQAAEAGENGEIMAIETGSSVSSKIMAAININGSNKRNNNGGVWRTASSKRRREIERQWRRWRRFLASGSGIWRPNVEDS
jgi:hypothetical protein